MAGYELEDYKFAKQELLSVINLQYTILSILVTASAAVFVFVFDKDQSSLSRIIFCGCLIIPGIYAFFGVLWLDQVYRQRRLAAYIFEIETTMELNRLNKNGKISRAGWEHYIQNQKKDKRIIKNRHAPSREYYFICIGLFLTLPPITYVLVMRYTGCSCLTYGNEYFVPACIGVVMYILLIAFSIPYFYSICRLSNVFVEDNDFENATEAHSKETTASVKS